MVTILLINFGKRWRRHCGHWWLNSVGMCSRVGFSTARKDILYFRLLVGVIHDSVERRLVRWLTGNISATAVAQDSSIPIVNKLLALSFFSLLGGSVQGTAECWLPCFGISMSTPLLGWYCATKWFDSRTRRRKVGGSW